MTHARLLIACRREQMRAQGRWPRVRVVKRRQRPQYALVVWLSNCQIGCIPLEDVDAAVPRNAILIGREDCEMLGMVSVEWPQSNPRRVEDDGDSA